MPDGRVHRRGAAGPSNAKAVGAAAARQALEAAIGAAFADAGLESGPAEVACLGLAGFDRPEDRRLLGEWAEAGHWAERLVLVNDGDLVVAAGTPEGWGMGVIAGTARSPSRRDARRANSPAGGWGHLIGDEGSAYGSSSQPSRSPAGPIAARPPPMSPDPLTVHLCRALGIAAPTGLSPPSTLRGSIAARSPRWLRPYSRRRMRTFDRRRAAATRRG